MSTYGDKIRKYEARVKKAVELGIEPRENDLEKLYYYVSRAEKKGADHKTKLKDKIHNFTKGVEKNLPELLETAGKVLLSEAASAKLAKDDEED